MKSPPVTMILAVAWLLLLHASSSSLLMTAVAHNAQLHVASAESSSRSAAVPFHRDATTSSEQHDQEIPALHYDAATQTPAAAAMSMLPQSGGRRILHDDIVGTSDSATGESAPKTNYTAPFDAAAYTNSYRLDDALWLYWTVDDVNNSSSSGKPHEKPHIHFAIKGRTAGYVAIGFSEVGAMVGSDMVVGLVDSETGQATVADGFSFNKTWGGAVLLDQQQDVFIEAGEERVEASDGGESATWTIIQFWRQLDTGDCNDRPIRAGEYVRLIWAMGSLDSVEYHGPERRGGAAIKLVEPSGGKVLEREIDPSWGWWNFTVPEYRVPSNFTTYTCNYLEVPFTTKTHITGYGVIVDTNVPQALHHAVLYSCIGDEVDFAKSIGPNYDCTNGQPCSNFAALWAVGGKDFYLPEGVGIPYGPGGHMHVVMEVHYTNPGGRTDIVDRSGLFFRTSPKLLPVDAGAMAVGAVPFDSLLRIPPGIPSWAVDSICPSQCTTKNISPEIGKITLIASGNHMHTIGRQLHSELYREGKLVASINRQDYYDFEFQQLVDLSPGIDVYPGDEIRTRCTFNSTGRTNVTLGGHSSAEEMCINFLLFYPANFSAGGFSTGNCFNYSIGFTGMDPAKSNITFDPSAPLKLSLASCNPGDESEFIGVIDSFDGMFGYDIPFESTHGCSNSTQPELKANQVPGVPALQPSAAPPPPAISASCLVSFNRSELSFRACQKLSGGFELMWTATEESDGHVQVDAVLLKDEATARYAAFGLSPDGGMVGASVVAGVQGPDGGSIVVNKYYLGSKSSSGIKLGESKIEFSQLAGEMNQQQMRLRFSMHLDKAQAEAVKIIWAHGPHTFASNKLYLTRHSNSDAYSGDVNFNEGTATTAGTSNDKIVHGSIATAGFGVLMPLGMLVARYFRHYDPLWFYSHIVLQVSGYGLGLGGFILGLFLWNDSGEAEMGHLVIAFIITILATLQMSALIFRPKKDSKLRGGWNLGHHNVGRLVVILAIVNIYIGLTIIESDALFYILYSVFLGVIILACVGLEVFGFAHKRGHAEEKKPKDVDATAEESEAMA